MNNSSYGKIIELKEFEMLCYRKTRKILSSRTNVFSYSISYSATCLPYIDDMKSFAYNAMHNVFTNTGSFNHIKKSFMYVSEQLVTHLNVLQCLRLQE